MLYAGDARQELEKIVREREAKLEEQGQLIKKEVEPGTTSKGRAIDLEAARIALLEYRKKRAETPADQIKLQSEIVKIAKAVTALVKKE